MARKKQEVAETQAPSTTVSPITESENTVKATEKKVGRKPVRRKTITAEKTEEKVEKTAEMTTEKIEPSKEKKTKKVEKAKVVKQPIVEESESKTESAPIKQEEKTEKPKRGRKPTTKKPTKEKTESKEVTPITVEEKVVAPQTPAEIKQEDKKTEEKPQEKKTVTRAEKNATLRSIIKELLAVRAYKWSELLEECAKLYEKRVESKEGETANDVRGRIGSVCDTMKKEGELTFDGGMYALNKGNKPEEKPQESPKTVEKVEEKTDEKKEKQLPMVKPESKIAPVFDMSLLLATREEKQGGRVEKVQPVQKSEEPKKEEKEETKKETTPTVEEKTPTLKRTIKKSEEPKKAEEKKERKTVKPQKTSDDKLKEEFLKKIRTLGGKYFEYYSIYLLERYSLANGRRVDGFKVTGGENDGGIDGEIEVTDRIGFKETIYIQAKNWKPVYGKETSWVIGEKDLREFIGAIAYRQALEGKQNCRGIFITTSFFTSGSKEILYKMSDKLVGYDGNDLFEAAKECSFGLVQKDGQWKLDEKLLAGEKAFFNLF